MSLNLSDRLQIPLLFALILTPWALLTGPLPPTPLLLGAGMWTVLSVVAVVPGRRGEGR